MVTILIRAVRRPRHFLIHVGSNILLRCSRLRLGLHIRLRFFAVE